MEHSPVTGARVGDRRQFDHFVVPDRDEIERCAREVGLRLDGEDRDLLPRWLQQSLDALELLDDIGEDATPLRAVHRDPGRPPRPGEDPYNAFVRLCEVRGSAEGPLSGRRVAVKDCIAVAGVPQTDGGGRRPYLVPTEDAVVVERILDAGATIVGKTNMEDLAVGVGEGSYFGAARNPHDPARSTGGSSTGSAAAVAAGLVDMALGADQAGSVRVPAAWCGLVGMKATHGLVPTFGLTHMDHTLDHIGPITKTVADSAQMLEVIAGADWRDPQWARDVPPVGRYRQTADMGLAGLRVGVVGESLASPALQGGTRRAFESAVAALSRSGAVIQDVSVPLWPLALPIFSAVVAHGVYGMWVSHQMGFGHLGRVVPDVVAANATETPSHQLPPRLITRLVLARYLHGAERGVPLARAHNLRLRLRQQVDELFRQVDVLLTPTVVTVAFRLLQERGSRGDRMTRGGGTELLNTCALDLSGHPALTVPWGTGDEGLPTGIQVVGPLFGEEVVYRAGFALEKLAG